MNTKLITLSRLREFKELLISIINSKTEAINNKLNEFNTAISTGLATKSDVDHRHDNASINSDGFMSASDKAKLNGIATGATNTAAPVNSDWNVTDANNLAYIKNKPTIHNYSAGTGISINNDVISCNFIKFNYLSNQEILQRLVDKIEIYHPSSSSEEDDSYYSYNFDKLGSISYFMYLGFSSDYGITINFNFDADSAINSHFYAAGGIARDDFTFTNNTGKELTFGIIHFVEDSYSITNLSSSDDMFEGSSPSFSNSNEITLANGASQYINGYGGNNYYLVVAYLNRYEPALLTF